MKETEHDRERKRVTEEDEEEEEAEEAEEVENKEEKEEKPEEAFRYTHPLLPNDQWTIQQNKRATSQWQDHKVTWHYLDNVKADSDDGKKLEDMGRGRETGDGSFVRDLKMGDVITVWGKARFPGWVNTVEKVKVEVYWAV